MNEEHFGSRIRQALNHSAADIPQAASRRLEAARHLALARQKQSAAELRTVGAGSHSFKLGGPTPYLTQVLAIVALLLGMWISFYWHSVQYITELEEVDSALLSDDLPPEAFMDDDFFAWLKDDTSEE